MNIIENFSWYVENIKYYSVEFGSDNFETIEIPGFVKERINNESLSHSFIIWYLKKDNLLGIKYNKDETIINLNDHIGFSYFVFREKGEVSGGKIVLVNTAQEKKLFISANIDLLDKLYSVIRIWLPEKIELTFEDN